MTDETKPKHAGGRPLKFKSVEELQAKIDEYLATTPENEITISGLAYFLDCETETLRNYEKRDKFFATVKRAKQRVEWAYEKDLRRHGRSGDIFALKNFGWTDKTEVDNTHRFPNAAELALKLKQERAKTLTPPGGRRRAGAR
jgi:hypothetical protein